MMLVGNKYHALLAANIDACTTIANSRGIKMTLFLMSIWMT
jgi:hypothetical protein